MKLRMHFDPGTDPRCQCVGPGPDHRCQWVGLLLVKVISQLVRCEFDRCKHVEKDVMSANMTYISSFDA